MNHEKKVLSSAEINRTEYTNSEIIEESQNPKNTAATEKLSKEDTFKDDVTSRSDVSEMVIAPSRRVSFPESDRELVTGYLEPANPWESVAIVKTIPELCELYKRSCKKHNTEPLKSVLDHLQTLDLTKTKRQSCLSLKNNILTPDSCEALEEVLKRVQYEFIDLSECQLNDTAATALFDMIEYYEATNELDITGNPDISSRGLQSCISMIRRSRALQVVTIRGTPLSESNSSNLGKSLNNSFLHTIKLEHCGLTGRPIAALCNALKKNNTLKELWLAHNDLSPADAEKLADLLRSNGYLEFLDISNNSIKDLGVRYIVKALIEQSTNIEQDSSRSKREAIEAPSGTGKENSSTPLKNINSGRSMLDTLLTMNPKLPMVEIDKGDDDGWDFGQADEHKDLSANKEMSTSFVNQNKLCSNESSIRVDCELVSGNVTSLNQPNAVISTNNNEYSICDVSKPTSGEAQQTVQTKAVDFNKNTKIDEMETSSDSAFESASEGDTRFKEAPKINNYKQMEFETDLYTKDPIVGNENLSDSGITLSESRLRSLSSDSLSSENSLDTSDSNLLDKINDKITKNDTLTRQKHTEEPVVTTKRPKGLQALILWNNNITRESGEFISDLLATTNSLELLNIGKNILSNEFITKIEESLKTNCTLTNLGLQSSHLSCAGIKTLSSVLQFGGNFTLERIDIRDNNLQVEGLTALAEALKSNTCVTRVDVDDVPKRISDGANDMQFHYSRVLHTLRSLCSKNDSSQESATITNNIKKTGQYLTSRKISLTCPSIRTPLLESTLKMDQLSVDIKKKSSVRLRSPLPSPPTASPSSSPVPSPSRSRFQVFRVSEIKTPPSPDIKALPKEIPKFSNPFKSRFHVTLVKSSENTDSTNKKTGNTESSTGKNSERHKNPVIGINTLNRNASNNELMKTNSLISLESPQSSNVIQNTRHATGALHSLNQNKEIDNSTESNVEAYAKATESTHHEFSSEPKQQSEIKTFTKYNQNNLEENLCTDKSQKIFEESLNVCEEKASRTEALSDQPNSQSCNNVKNNEVMEFNSFCGFSSTSYNELALTSTNKCLETIPLAENQTTSNESLIDCSDNIQPEPIYASSNSADKVTDQISYQIEITENKEILEIRSGNILVPPEKTSFSAPGIDTRSQEETVSEKFSNPTEAITDGKNVIKINSSEEEKEKTSEISHQKIESLKAEGEPRARKSSWISTAGCPATVDKLLSLFQHPAHLFTRTSSPERDRKPDDSETTSQSLVSVRKQSPPGGLFSWHKASIDPKIADVKRLSSESIINSGFQASFLDVASKQIRGFADFGKQVFRQNITFGENVNIEPQQSCESIPTEVKLEIKENISPEHTITPNSIAFLQTIQQDNNTPSSVQSDNEENSQSVQPTSAQTGKPTNDTDLGDLMSSDITGNNL